MISYAFLTALLAKLSVGQKGKPAPSHSVLLNGLHILTDYGTFQYPKASGFELTPHDGKRL